eukprot:2207228-Pyramimonas_sp.AAC.1
MVPRITSGAQMHHTSSPPFVWTNPSLPHTLEGLSTCVWRPQKRAVGWRQVWDGCVECSIGYDSRGYATRAPRYTV